MGRQMRAQVIAERSGSSPVTWRSCTQAVASGGIALTGWAGSPQVKARISAEHQA
jgi:hypothetical protein